MLQSYFGATENLVKVKAYLILSYIINEDENSIINATDENIAFIIRILQDALEGRTCHQLKKFLFRVYILHLSSCQVILVFVLDDICVCIMSCWCLYQVILVFVSGDMVHWWCLNLLDDCGGSTSLMYWCLN